MEITVKSGEKEYRLQDFSEHGDYWLEAESGEGMSFSSEELFKLLDKYFCDNF